MELQNGIFEVEADDYARVLGVWEASVRATHHFVAESDIVYFKPIVREAIPQVHLACMRDSDGIVAGYVAVGDDMIEMLFIHPDWRGKGIGRKLLLHAIDNMGAVRLDVNEQNEQAVGFYLHMGLIVEGRSELDGFGKPYPLLHLRIEQR
jgi:putative acetyltransferase